MLSEVKKEMGCRFSRERENDKIDGVGKDYILEMLKLSPHIHTRPRLYLNVRILASHSKWSFFFMFSSTLMLCNACRSYLSLIDFPNYTTSINASKIEKNANRTLRTIFCKPVIKNIFDYSVLSTFLSAMATSL